MSSPGASYDPLAVAHDVTRQLNEHKEQVASTLSTPATTPMFTREASGALVDRAGRVVVAAPTNPKR